MKHVMAGVAQNGNIVGIFMPQVIVCDMVHADTRLATTCGTPVIGKRNGFVSDDAPMLTEQIFTVWNVALLARTVMQKLTAQIDRGMRFALHSKGVCVSAGNRLISLLLGFCSGCLRHGNLPYPGKDADSGFRCESLLCGKPRMSVGHGPAGCLETPSSIGVVAQVDCGVAVEGRRQPIGLGCVENFHAHPLAGCELVEGFEHFGPSTGSAATVDVFRRLAV